MEKEFASIFDYNKDVSINEYDIDKLIERVIEVNENDFPIISIGNTDKESPKIHGKITSKEYVLNEPDNNIKDEKDDTLNIAYTEEETEKYKDLERSLKLSEDDLEIADSIDDVSLENISILFPATSDKYVVDEDDGFIPEDVLSAEQSYIINNIYSKDQNKIHESIKVESGLKEGELDSIQSVDDFQLEDSYDNILSDEKEKSNHLEMREYTDEELLDINNILDDEEEEDIDNLSNINSMIEDGISDDFVLNNNDIGDYVGEIEDKSYTDDELLSLDKEILDNIEEYLSNIEKEENRKEVLSLDEAILNSIKESAEEAKELEISAEETEEEPKELESSIEDTQEEIKEEIAEESSESLVSEETESALTDIEEPKELESSVEEQQHEETKENIVEESSESLAIEEATDTEESKELESSAEESQEEIKEEIAEESPESLVSEETESALTDIEEPKELESSVEDTQEETKEEISEESPESLVSEETESALTDIEEPKELESSKVLNH